VEKHAVHHKQHARVYQFKVSLKDIIPIIWRRIQVPEKYTFWDLHVAIQDAMGWLDYHLHEFRILNPMTCLKESIGIPDYQAEGPTMLPSWEVMIADYFVHDNTVAEYEYDFGDGWQHLLILENIVPKEQGKRYPLCMAGEQACPPEDCGGPPGYEEFLKAIRDADHEEHESLLRWIGGSFSPVKFNPAEVKFDNPKRRWKIAFERENWK